MSTQAQTIIDGAVKTSLANDAASSDLSSDTAELLNVLNRKLQQLYVLAGTPSDDGGMGQGDFFAASTLVAVAASPVALPVAAFRHIISDSSGVRVATVTRADLVDGVAEMPPAVLIEQQKLLSAGRPGDPVIGALLTVRYTPVPGLMTSSGHYIGAVTPSDASTTAWPDAAGNPFLVTWLALYLARKAGDRDPEELASLKDELLEAVAILAKHIGIEATVLTTEDREA
jgi:hypothetical protein